MTATLNHSIDMLVKQYSSLFTLPTLRAILFYTLTLVMLGSVISCLTFEFSVSSFIAGVGAAALSFLIIVLVDLLISKTLMKDDLIFNFRRCLALSLFSNLTWFLLILLGCILAVAFNSEIVWIKLVLLGFCASLILRLIVFFTTSTRNYITACASAFLQPLVCLFLIFLIWQILGKPISTFIFMFLAAAIPIVLIAAFSFVLAIDIVGKKSPLRVSAFSLFRAFMANWTEDVNEPLEEIFEFLGDNREVQVNLLAFKGKSGYKAVLAVPCFHPGPFKNVGSSPIPYLIQKTISEKLNCVVAVPHGLFGHELDLASQKQNKKVLDAILNSLSFEFQSPEVSPMIRVSEENASATCQIFKECALFTLTLAPKTTEDFPKEIEDYIASLASKHGLSNFIVVNAHNSIDSLDQSEEEFKLLEAAASQSLKKALKSKFKPLKVGAAKLNPKEYGISEGMGPGGIVAMTLDVDGEIYAYVIFDGNNMISGLREKILEGLKDLKIAEGEVMTSDTHIVNAIVLGGRGYHPIGEVMDHEKLVKMVKDVVSEAIKDMEPVAIGWRTISVSNVKVIGERQIEIMGEIAYKAMKRAKKAAVTIFPIIGMALVGLLLAI